MRDVAGGDRNAKDTEGFGHAPHKNLNQDVPRSLTGAVGHGIAEIPTIIRHSRVGGGKKLELSKHYDVVRQSGQSKIGNHR